MREAQKQKLNRQEAILLSLSNFDYLSRSQMQQLHSLSGNRNALRVLDDLSEYVSSFRCETGENIYYLSRAGRERIGSNTVRQKNNQVNHYLMRNDVYIKLRPERWSNEKKFTVTDVVSIVADAYFSHEKRNHFLEVDHLQRMFKNKEKIDRYMKMKDTGVFQKQYGYFPRLVWVTAATSRKEQLSKWCEGLDTKIYTWDEIK